MKSHVFPVHQSTSLKIIHRLKDKFNMQLAFQPFFESQVMFLFRLEYQSQFFLKVHSLLGFYMYFYSVQTPKRTILPFLLLYNKTYPLHFAKR